MSDAGKAKSLDKAGEYLAKDFTISNDVFNPGQIIFHDAADNNFFVQGTSLKYVTDGYTCNHAGNVNIPLIGQRVYVAASKLKIDGQKAVLSNAGILSMNPTVNIPDIGVVSASAESLGNIYIINDEGKVLVTRTSSTADNYKWDKINIDGVSQYFAFSPNVTSGGKHFATLRTGFSYKVKNPDIVKVYQVEEIGSSGDGAVLRLFEPDEVIPANLAVILETTSANSQDNILIPWNLEYSKENTVLYNKYGTRLHCYTGLANSGDQYDNCTEDGIGYFKVKYTKANTVPIYKLSVNDEGEVGFWTKVAKDEVISGNEAYAYTPCALFPRAKTPVIDPAEATEQAGTPINVNISSATAGATILYSTDGENWNEYTGTLAINSDEPGHVTLYAKATKAGFITSHIATATYTFTGSPYTATSLADLIASGDTEGKYNITDLTCVYYVPAISGNTDGALIICKDDGNYAAPDVMAAQGQIDFMSQVKQTVESDIAAIPEYQNWTVPAQYDQSNWVALRLPDEAQGGLTVDQMAAMLGHRLTAVKGQLVDAVNPELQLDNLPVPGDVNAAARNVYVAASFQGTQTSTVNGSVYFFVQPKPMELANVTWVQWDSTKFVAPQHDAGHAQWNPVELTGEFGYNNVYQTDKTVVPEDGHLYAMEAIIKVVEPATLRGKRRATATKQYVVYPLSLTRTSSNVDGVITDVTRLTTAREVAAVDYYNLAGQRSQRPWQGVNIVVTRYTDGTTATRKVVR